MPRRKPTGTSSPLPPEREAKAKPTQSGPKSPAGPSLAALDPGNEIDTPAIARSQGADRKRGAVHLVFFFATILLLAAVVNFSMLYYSRYIPGEFTAPYKGVTGLLVSLFALFGIKWEKIAKTSDSFWLNRPYVAIPTLLVLLGISFAANKAEERHMLQIYALPGTEIWVDGKFNCKIDSPEDGLPLAYTNEKICLKWGVHEIKLQNNPLCPGQQEVFWENIQFKDAWAKAASDFHNRPLGINKSRTLWSMMLVSPLVQFMPGTDTANQGKAEGISIALSRTWNSVISGCVEEVSVVKQPAVISKIAPAMFTLGIKDNPRVADSFNLTVKPASPPDPFELQIPISTAQEQEAATPQPAHTPNADYFISQFFDYLVRQIHDEALISWIMARLENPAIKNPLLAQLEDAISPGYREAILVAQEEVAKESLEAIATNADALTNAADLTKAVAAIRKVQAELPGQIAPGSPLPLDLAIATELEPQFDQLSQTLSGNPQQAVAQAQVQQVQQAVDKIKDQGAKPRIRIYYHISSESQRTRMDGLAQALSSGNGSLPMIVTAGIQNVEGRGFIPDQLEVRFFEPSAGKKNAELILDFIRSSPLLRSGAKARISYVIPSDYDKRNSVDLSTHIEIWAAKDSF